MRYLNVRKELKGIGVRIEDDILITEKSITEKDGTSTKKLSCEILSVNCPKAIEDLEVLLNMGSSGPGVNL